MENVLPEGTGHAPSLPNATGRGPGPDGKFFTTVNDSSVKFSDATPNGGRILEKAGLLPIGDYILIQLKRHSTQSIGLDETVDLRVDGTEAFRAFKNDRIYRFTVNDHGFEWGESRVSEPELRALAHVNRREIIVLDRGDDEVDLHPGDVVDLADAGTEHLHTEKRQITVFYEGAPREIDRGVYTTEQLVTLFGVQAGYILEFINPEGQLTPLQPGAKIRVKDGMKFFEQVPCGGSS